MSPTGPHADIVSIEVSLGIDTDCTLDALVIRRSKVVSSASTFAIGF